MSRNDASKMSGVLCIIAVTYCAWKITTYRENIERYFAQQVYQNVTALITLYSDGHTVNFLEDKKSEDNKSEDERGVQERVTDQFPIVKSQGLASGNRKGHEIFRE